MFCFQTYSYSAVKSYLKPTIKKTVCEKAKIEFLLKNISNTNILIHSKKDDKNLKLNKKLKQKIVYKLKKNIKKIRKINILKTLDRFGFCIYELY